MAWAQGCMNINVPVVNFLGMVLDMSSKLIVAFRNFLTFYQNFMSFESFSFRFN